MSRFPGALWRGPIPNMTPAGRIRPILGLVLHIEQGTETGTDSWFHNPAAQASADFGNPKTGAPHQWVDTADKSWAEAVGNPRWVAVEHEGFTGDPLTPSQLENDAQLLAWLHRTEGVTVRVCANPLPVVTQPYGGLTWHAAGGVPWGNHPQCPGQPIIDAAPAIVARAVQIVTPPPAPTGDDPAMYVCYAPGRPTIVVSPGAVKPLQDNAEVDALRALGVPVRGVTADQFDLILAVVQR